MAELNYDGIVRLNAENDKATSLQIGVYNGIASITVFSNRQITAKFSLPQAAITKMKDFLQNVLTAKPGERFGIHFSKFNPETKKSDPQGVFFIGRDDKAVIYFGVTSSGHPPQKFPLRTGLGFDLSEPLNEVSRSELMARTIHDLVGGLLQYAIANTSFKREMPQRGGGGGGFGGGGGYGGGNRGGGGGGGDDGNIFG